MSIMERLSEQTNLIELVIAGVIVVLGIWLIVVSVRLKKLRKQYTAVMGNSGVANIEDVIVELKSNIAEQQQKTNRLQEQLAAVQSTIPTQKNKVGLHRYSTFNDGGSDFSFSLALVNDQKDGIVLSGIHSRESTYLYAKTIEKAESAYPLTEEEKKAINEAK